MFADTLAVVTMKSSRSNIQLFLPIHREALEEQLVDTFQGTLSQAVHGFKRSTRKDVKLGIANRKTSKGMVFDFLH